MFLVKMSSYGVNISLTAPFSSSARHTINYTHSLGGEGQAGGLSFIGKPYAQYCPDEMQL